MMNDSTRVIRRPRPPTARTAAPIIASAGQALLAAGSPATVWVVRRRAA